MVRVSAAKLSVILAFCGILIALPFLGSNSASASPHYQDSFSTPTPDDNGRIYYDVLEGDNCNTIYLRFNITFDQLRRLNNLGEDCIIHPGDKLLIATAPVTPGADPLRSTRTPTKVVEGVGNICVLLYKDVNGNGFADDGEAALGEGAVSLSETTGKTTLTGDTSTNIEKPTCFNEIPNGVYNVSVAVPDGYNATTRTNYTLTLNAGDNSIIDFGAQLSSSAEPVPVKSGGRSPLLAILGIAIIAASGVLAVYARRATINRRKLIQ
ncbi:MAG TPA: SdrD B-like domain-containing protein [Bellilinea sp.]|nr:SdrD B-like domain-containing protein [Bellilinea sp.]